MICLKHSTALWLLLPFLAVVLPTTANEIKYAGGFSETCEQDSSDETCASDAYQKDTAYVQAFPPKPNRNFTAQYFLYKNPDNPEEYQELLLNNLTSIQLAKPFKNAPWKILVHGYTNKKTSQFPVNVKTAYLQHLKDYPDNPFNLIVFDWGDGARIDFRDSLKTFKFLYQHAVENVQPAGEQLGDMILYLQQQGFIDIVDGLYNVHLIGHSLGSHVSGQTARRVYDKSEIMVKRISALDPAGPLFSRNNLFGKVMEMYPRVQRNRVGYLDVYHTSRMYGMTEEIGDVDFYINGGMEQPSCLKHIPQIQACSHQFAPEIFAQTINNATMLACTGCYSYKEYRNGECECEDTPVLGEYVTEETLDGFPLASGRAFYYNAEFDPPFEKGIEFPDANEIFN